MIDVEARIAHLERFLDKEIHLAEGLGVSPEACTRQALLKEIRSQSEHENALETRLAEEMALTNRLLADILKHSQSPWAFYLRYVAMNPFAGPGYRKWTRLGRLMHSRMRRLGRKGLVRYQGDRHGYTALEITKKGMEKIQLGLDTKE